MHSEYIQHCPSIACPEMGGKSDKMNDIIFSGVNKRGAVSAGLTQNGLLEGDTSMYFYLRLPRNVGLSSANLSTAEEDIHNDCFESISQQQPHIRHKSKPTKCGQNTNNSALENTTTNEPTHPAANSIRCRQISILNIFLVFWFVRPVFSVCSPKPNPASSRASTTA